MAYLHKLVLSDVKDPALKIIFQRSLEFTQLRKNAGNNLFKNKAVSCHYQFQYMFFLTIISMVKILHVLSARTFLNSPVVSKNFISRKK